MQRLLIPAFAAIFIALAAAPLRAEAPRHDIFDLIPPDALAAIGTRNLRNASDDLTDTIEGMDRGHLLLGGRPLDLIKSMLGFSVGVNDMAGAAIALMPPADGSDDHSFAKNYVAIVAVTNANDFLNGNCGRVFGSTEGQATCFHGHLGGVHVQVLDSHVAISPRRDLLDALRTRDEDRSFASHCLGQEGLATARQGDVFLYMHNSACAVHPAIFIPRLQPLLQFMPPMPDVESKVLSFDFDPLGVFVRGRSVFRAGSEEAKLSTAISENRSEPGGPMLSVPDRPFIIAGGINASIITRDIAHAWNGNACPQRILDTLAIARSADFAAYPAEGYPLNESMLILRGDDGQTLGQSMRQLLEGHERTAVSWSENRFEARLRSPSTLETLLLNTLFGPAGPRGVIGATENAAYFAPSRREATLAMAREAAAGRGSPVAENHIVQSMQSWMPASRDIEIYIDLAELVPALIKVAPANALTNESLPQFERGAPPLGIAVELHPGAAHWTAILPSNVLAPLVDSQMQQLRKRAARMNPEPAAP